MATSLLGYIANPPVLGVPREQAQTQVEQAQVPAMQARAQLEQEQVQRSQMERQMMQRQLRDQDILSRAYANVDWSQPSASRDVVNYALKNGISPSGLMAWQQHDMEMRTKANALSKSARDAEIAQNEEAGKLVEAVQGSDNPGAAWDTALPRLKALAPKVNWDNVQPNKQSLDTLMGSLDYHKQHLANAENEQKLREGEQKLTEAQIKTGQEKKAAALQELSGVDASTYPSWRNKYQSLFPDAPMVFDQGYVDRAKATAVPIKEQPEFGLKSEQLKRLQNGSVDDFNKELDTIAAADPEIAARYKAELPTAFKYGGPNAAINLLGRANTELGQRQAQNTPEKAFIAQEIAKGSSREEAQRKWTDISQKPPQAVMLEPKPGGGYKAVGVRPGEDVAPGTVTPAGASSMEVPTSQTRAMAEKAPRVTYFVDRVNDLINQNEKELGPLSGRWSEFTAGKIGLPNKGYTQIRTDLGLLETALMNMHIGARGGERIMEHFHNLINGSVQSTENLRAALGEIKDYANVVSKEGQAKSAQGGGAQSLRVQKNPRTGAMRYSTDGGTTWQNGQPPQQ